MDILYISQHFPPEIGAAQARAYDMARYLVKLGNNVTVVTSFPNFTIGVTTEKYKNKFLI